MSDINWTTQEISVIDVFMPDAVIWGGDSDMVAAIFGNAGLGVSAIERAERIVKAVRCHDKLMDIYRAAKAFRDGKPQIGHIAHSKISRNLVLKVSDEWGDLVMQLSDAIDAFDKALAAGGQINVLL